MEETKRTRPVQSAGFPFQRIIVTGAAGFIGANFTSLMLSWHPDLHIAGFDSLTYAGSLENLDGCLKNSRFTFIKGDIREKEAVEETFCREKPDAVVNFAAESHVDNSISNPSLFLETNVLGTGVLLDAAVRHGVRFHQVSTDEVYGSLGETGYFYEDTPYAPHSPYSASKASSDMLVKSYMDTYGFPANITNCSNNYGPYQFPEKLIPLMIHNALEGKKLPVYGDGLNIRDWLYVEDHVKGIDMVQEKGRLFETYNIGGHNEKTNIEIVHIILDTLLEYLPEEDERRKHISKDLITFVEDRKGHDKRYAIAPDKIREELGWYPETDFDQGIRKTIKWYLEHEDWVKNVTSGEYQKYYADMYE